MADSEKLYNFKKMLKKLQGFRGSGTELISVYIAAGSPMHDMVNKLREEMGQASNIKSKSTKLNVIGALERILNYLKIYKKTPENGIAIFCGNISDNAAKVDIELFSIDPPQVLQIGAYRCDSKFFLEPLEQMLESADSYGIVVFDGREATLAIVKGTLIHVVKKITSMAHAKVRKGGQSQRRYQRLVEEQIEYYYKKVGESMDEAFVGKVKGVIVGGPGPTKENFMKMKPYNYQLQVLGVVDTGYTDEFGVREVLSKSETILAKQEAIKEKQLVDRFVDEVVHDRLAIYGEVQVRQAIVSKQADKILLSEGLEHIVGVYTDAQGNEVKKVFRQDPPSEYEGMKLKDSVSLIDDLSDLAREHSIEIEMISTNTAEGAQFFAGFGGVGAFIRYRK
ncbi:peptide chain release factor 1 [Candidatus Micrarchaeota archaeon]|nr:peptide chain release factor 1 [Candidatus Micrarchaeota archaeon]